MRILLVALIAAALAGCASTASPVWHEGQYYMVGDDACSDAYPLTKTRVVCYDVDGNETGYRDAMTEAELNMWMHQQKMAELQQQQQELEAAARRTRLNQQLQQYSLPSFQADNSSPTVYNQVGSSVIGSNGITYKEVGNSIIGSDGTVCQSVGSQLICK
jgi:hypothetical protein